jgi:hypothetical protein
MALGAVSADAADWTNTRFDVTRVQLVKHADAARVRFTVQCHAGASFSVNVSVHQDDDGVNEKTAYYETTRPISGTCSGYVQTYQVVVTPEPLGLYAPADGRLNPGPATNVIFGVYDDQAFAQEDSEPVRPLPH